MVNNNCYATRENQMWNKNAEATGPKVEPLVAGTIPETVKYLTFSDKMNQEIF